MKMAGITLLCQGGLMILSWINRIFTKYDLYSSHDVVKALGGFGCSVIITALGLSLIHKSRRVPRVRR